MSKCFDHETTFPDTHRHFCPAIDISRRIPIVCWGLRLKKINLKNKTCLDTQFMQNKFKMSNFPKKKTHPYKTKPRANECTFHSWNCIWIEHYIAFVFYTWGTHIQFKYIQFFAIIHVYIYIHVICFRYFCIYIYIYIYIHLFEFIYSFCLLVYIYIYREREKYIFYIYIYIYIFLLYYIYINMLWATQLNLVVGLQHLFHRLWGTSNLQKQN